MSQRKNYLIVPLLFLISFGVYLKTLCPTITFADSGELITASYLLGIPHTPGSPLYCLLGRLFTLLPFGSVAYRVNLMSAFFASLTVVLIYFIVLKLLTLDYTTIRLSDHKTIRPSNHPTILGHGAAIVASLSFAFSKSFWSYALVAEVYTLKAFFIALLIFILLKWKESLPTPNSELRTPNSTPYLYLLALLYGLSFANHLTMLLLAPGFLYLILITDWRRLAKGRNLFFISLLFLLGLSLYLYLPLRSHANPPLDWGNPETLKNFIWMVTGKQYQFRLFALPWNQLPQQVKEYLTNFREEFTWLPLLLGLLGLGYLLKEKGRLFLFFLLLLLADSLFNLCQSVIKAPAHFFIPSFLLFSLCMGYGLERGGSFILRFIKGRGYVFLLLLVIPLAPLTAHYHSVDQCRNYAAYDWARSVLELVEEKGIIISKLSFPFWYLRYVEEQRPDVTTVSFSILSHPFPWYLKKMARERPQLDIIPRNYRYKHLVDSQEVDRLSREYKGRPKGRLAWIVSTAITNYIIDHNIEKCPVYITFTDSGIAKGYYLISRGPVYQIKKEKPFLLVKDPEIEHETRINFSDSLCLLGYDLHPPGPIKPGELLHLTYYWELLKGPLEGRMKVILTFADEEGCFEVKDGLPGFYECHLLAHGFPLNYSRGQVIKEDYFCLPPPDLSPGIYYLYLIIANLEEERLLETGETSLPRKEGFVRIGKVEVVPR